VEQTDRQVGGTNRQNRRAEQTDRPGRRNKQTGQAGGTNRQDRQAEQTDRTGRRNKQTGQAGGTNRQDRHAVRKKTFISDSMVISTCICIVQADRSERKFMQVKNCDFFYREHCYVQIGNESLRSVVVICNFIQTCGYGIFFSSLGYWIGCSKEKFVFF
jgi:hypothetical protein